MTTNIVQLESSLYMICKVSKIFIVTDIRVVTLLAAVACINIAISLFGTLANGLVIMAYYRNPRLRTVQNTIFFLHATTDFSVTAFVEPTYVAAIFSLLVGRRSCPLWDISTVLSMVFVQLSLVTIVILSLQSYITLAYPYHSQSITKSRLIKTNAVCFFFVLCLSLGIFWHKYFLLYGTPVIVIFTLTTVSVTWCWTYKLVARHHRAIQTTQTPSSSRNMSRRKILRSTVTALLIILSLLACYFLLLCVFFATFDYNTETILWRTGVTLVYLNSLLNPCLVLWRSTSFREKVRNFSIC